MKKDIKRMADEKKIIVCIQRRKGERKGGRGKGRKGGKEQGHKEGTRVTPFWGACSPSVPHMNILRRSPGCTLLSDSRRCKLHKFLLWADSLLLHPLTTIRIPPCSPHTASICKFKKNLFIPSLVYDIISLDIETKSQVMST